MKTYTFWVTLEGKSPMKVAEDGRTASEARSIVESRFPGAPKSDVRGGILMKKGYLNDEEGFYIHLFECVPKDSSTINQTHW